MRKKLFSILLICVLILSLGACDGDSGPDISDQGLSGAEAPDKEASESASAEEEPIPILSEFTAEDLYGNAIDQDYLKDKKVTMINIWATYCSPCLGEMPDLGALNEEYADQGFQVLGIVTDVLNRDGSYSKEMVAKAQEIAETTGADYLHLLPSPDLIAVITAIPSNSVPLTFFVNDKGELLGYIYPGAQSKEVWAELIEAALAEEE